MYDVCKALCNWYVHICQCLAGTTWTVQSNMSPCRPVGDFLEQLQEEEIAEILGVKIAATILSSCGFGFSVDGLAIVRILLCFVHVDKHSLSLDFDMFTAVYSLGSLTAPVYSLMLRSGPASSHRWDRSQPAEICHPLRCFRWVLRFHFRLSLSAEMLSRPYAPGLSYVGRKDLW